MPDMQNLFPSLMKASRRSLYFPFSLGHFANDIVPCSVVVLAPAIALEMGLNPMEVGLLLTLHSFGSALGYLPSGLLADSFRNRGNLLMLTFWWVGLGYLLASWAPGFWSLAFLFALAGCGDAAWHPLATAILVQSDPQNRGQALGFHAIGGTLSAVIGPVIVGFLLASMDWRETLHWLILPTLLVGVLFLWIRKWVPEQPQRKAFSKEDLQHLWKTWTKKRGLLIICLISSYHMSLVALMSMIPLYLREFHGLSSAMTGLAFGMMVLFGAFMQPLMGRLSDRAGRRRVIVFGIATAACMRFHDTDSGKLRAAVDDHHVPAGRRRTARGDPIIGTGRGSGIHRKPRGHHPRICLHPDGWTWRLWSSACRMGRRNPVQSCVPAGRDTLYFFADSLFFRFSAFRQCGKHSLIKHE